MDAIASLLLFAAAGAQAGDHNAPDQSALSKPIAGQSSAFATILGGTRVRFDRKIRTINVTSDARPQISRDSADIIWAEFS